jgi:hypothetical protein
VRDHPANDQDGGHFSAADCDGYPAEQVGDPNDRNNLTGRCGGANKALKAGQKVRK